jgi:hypothetical protein
VRHEGSKGHFVGSDRSKCIFLPRSVFAAHAAKERIVPVFRVRLATVAVTFLFVAGCCLLCPKAIEDWPAQQGVVVDADTGEPLAGAYVIGRWRGYVSSQSVCFHAEGTRTDSQGRFVLPAWRNTGPYNNTRYQEFSDYSYLPGYESAGGSNERMRLRRFAGTREERLQSLERMMRGSTCLAAEASERNMLPYYEAIYREVEDLSNSPEGQKGIEWFQYMVARIAVSDKPFSSGTEHEAMIKAYIKDHLQ